MLSMMIAKCFAKGCHQKSNDKEVKDMKKWRPCTGCRSHWLHVTCGGFCSDCQPSSSNSIEAMKNSFCSQIEEKGRKCLKRSADRSPLSVRQKSQMSKRLEDSLGFKEGKENSSSVLGKRQRKPVQPPCLTPNPIVISPVKKSSPSNHDSSKFKKPPPAEPASKPKMAKKRKISVEKSLEPPGKKAKKAVSTAPGGTPKKYPSEPHTKFQREKLVKKVVEVKMAEDGTHNPDRLLFHVRSNQPIAHGEVEAEESYDWLKDLSHR